MLHELPLKTKGEIGSIGKTVLVKQAKARKIIFCCKRFVLVWENEKNNKKALQHKLKAMKNF